MLKHSLNISKLKEIDTKSKKEKFKFNCLYDQLTHVTSPSKTKLPKTNN
jgi:hypothetical protein